MDINSFPLITTKEEAKALAERKGTFVGRMLLKGKKVSEIRLHYVEYKLITYEITHNPSFIEKVINKNHEKKTQKIKMIANGSTGGVAWAEVLPEIIVVKDIDEDMVQLSDKREEDLISRGKKIATRIIHRHIGSIPELKVLSVESVFRPFWVAFYGEVVQGVRVSYLPIAADGCGSHRTY
ncbi:MAG: hypothetical protein ACM3TR_14810 [Caulobacteraceae bacterium]